VEKKKETRLRSDEIADIISDVEGADRAAARLAIAKGVAKAQDEWLPAAYIAEALVLELRTITETNLPGQRAADYLRDLASALEEKANLH